jgi:maltose-binding protein MalE
MKRSSLLFTAFAVLFLVSCGKYEDGPDFTLRSKKARIAGSWTLEKYMVDGVDLTSQLTAAGLALSFKYDKDGSYTEVRFLSGQVASTKSGTWELSLDKENLVVNYTSGTVVAYKILRLTNSELWLQETYGGNITETHFRTE